MNFFSRSMTANYKKMPVIFDPMFDVRLFFSPRSTWAGPKTKLIARVHEHAISESDGIIHACEGTCYRRDKLLARARNIIVAGWQSSGLSAWESIFLSSDPSLAPHLTTPFARLWCSRLHYLVSTCVQYLPYLALALCHHVRTV